MSRALTDDEQTLLARRRSNFHAFADERLEVLHDFAQRLELANPAAIVVDPLAFLPAISGWVRQQVADTEDDFIWLVTRLGYVIGECLIQRFGGGHWFVNDIPGSLYFAHYVVGRFPAPVNPDAMVSPTEAAAYLARLPAGRDLASFVSEICTEVATS
jgi:hypothetical protein